MKKFLSIILSPFKYFCLGCYYSLYGLFFPIMFIFNFIGSFFYRLYSNSKREKARVEIMRAAQEASSKVNSNAKMVNYKEALKNSKSNSKSKVVKKTIHPKYIKSRNLLISQLKTVDSSRNTKPVTYKYSVINNEGKSVSGYISAYTKAEVFNFLETEGNTVYKLQTNKLIDLLYGEKEFAKRKLKNKDLIFWLTQLSTYLKSGIPLTDAMRILSLQMGKKDKYKQRLFNAVVYQLIMGESFSEALLKQGKAFPPLLINMLKAAEATGELEETLDDMSSYYNEIEKTRKQMISALTYPTVVFVFSLAVVTFILLYIVPQFENIYASAGIELNGMTAFVLSASQFLKKYIIIILAIVVGIILIIILIYKKSYPVRYTFQKIAMNLPVFGKIIIYNEITIFTKTFSSLLKNNVFITDSIEILSKITNNEIYKEIMANTINNIAVGEKISVSFKDNWAIPDVAYYMIVTGESTGELAEMMHKVSLYYQEEHKNIVNALKSLIEPAIIIFLAVVVGGIVISVIVPMFSLYNQIS